MGDGNKAIKIHGGERTNGFDNYISGLTFVYALDSKIRCSGKTSNLFRIGVLLSSNIKNHTDDAAGQLLKSQPAYPTFANGVLCATDTAGCFRHDLSGIAIPNLAL
jgi:hypothetical protein